MNMVNQHSIRTYAIRSLSPESFGNIVKKRLSFGVSGSQELNDIHAVADIFVV
jgi:hypothetical protein